MQQEEEAQSYDLLISRWPAVKEGEVKDFCRVRLCVNDAESAKAVINKDIPTDFVGFTTGALNVVTGTIDTGITGAVEGADSALIAAPDMGTSGEIYIPKDMPAGLNASVFERACRVMCVFENGSYEWRPWGLTVDNGGVSWGSMQITQ